MTPRAFDEDIRVLFNDADFFLKDRDVGFQLLHGLFPVHGPVVAFNARLNNPKPCTFEIPVEPMGKPERVEDHLQVVLRTYRVAGTILEVVNVERVEMIDDRAIERPEHFVVDELQVNAGLD
jgi:hypothetical protein